MSKENTQEYRGNGQHEWEIVHKWDGGYTSRLRVPGGWIYAVMAETTEGAQMNNVFVPMPAVVKHKV